MQLREAAGVALREIPVVERHDGVSPQTIAGTV